MTHVPYQPPKRGATCQLAFVGEAPGSEEVEQQRPLVGPSGRVFNALLRTAGIDREACLVTNVFTEKAPEEGIDAWVKDAGKWAEAVSRLKSELDAHSPVVTVPLGDTALAALAGLRGIMGYRGNAMVGCAGGSGPGRKLLPTLHPAFVLREYKYFVPVVGDLHKAVREARLGPGLIRPIRRLLLDPTLAECHECARMCLGAKLVSADIETSYGQMTHIGFAWTEEDAVCIPFTDYRKVTRCYWGTVEEECEALELVRGVLEAPVPKVGQNYGGYDALWLLEKYGIRTMNFLEDTRLEHHALYPELKKSLEFLGSGYSDQGPWKKLGRRMNAEETAKGDD